MVGDLAEANKKHDPTTTLIDAMSHMDEVTHAVAILAFEDGHVEIRTGFMADWMVKGLLRQILDGYDACDCETEEIGDDE